MNKQIISFQNFASDAGNLELSLDDIPLPTSPSEEDYFSSPGAVCLRELLLSSSIAAADVTVPLQCLVEDSGRLSLHEASKAELSGFYDPAPADEDKQLLVRYAGSFKSLKQIVQGVPSARRLG